MKWKIDLNIVNDYNKSILAGFLIGFGVIINTITVNHLVGSIMFGFGLLTIINLALPLYTGKVGFYPDFTIKQLTKILVGNLIGITILVGLYTAVMVEFDTVLYNIAQDKVDKGFFTLFCAAMLCGMLIHLAVKMKTIITTLMAVSIFILIGAEHCIADFPFLLADFTLVNLIKWIIIVLGNSVGAIAVEFLIEGVNDELCDDNSK